MDIFKRKSTAKPLPILYHGDPVLRKQSVDVPEITDQIRDLADRMIVTMRENDGQGLAAPQIGRNINMITLETMPPSPDEPAPTSPGEMNLIPRMPMVMVNPKLSDFSDTKEWGSEACLSVPGFSGSVERSLYVQVTWQNLDGSTESYRCGGMLAICLQHEVDHLNGILYIDHLPDSEKAELAEGLDRLKAKTERQLKSRWKKRR